MCMCELVCLSTDIRMALVFDYVYITPCIYVPRNVYNHASACVYV